MGYFFTFVAGIFRLTSSNAELVYSNLAAMVNSSGASGPQQQAAVLFRLGQLGRQLQASGQQPFILPMPNPPAAHQTPADLSSKSSRNKSEL
ncbi:zinc finger and BTB domain-containing protein 4-like [Aphis craccivora]|uniref:Zinc finger and BTB domain-containing protein 4-like n=1 Tax=Aphis craccivora TaxID=307492 RepID=A0A6G0YE44_APHCR|nr:zinc finger and BTB domain-containing protein 4-like [Aphis craccivora]